MLTISFNGANICIPYRLVRSNEWPLSQNEDVSMKKLLQRFRDDESGATAIEYGLIAALIALAIVTGASMLGNALNVQFEGIANELSDTLKDD